MFSGPFGRFVRQQSDSRKQREQSPQNLRAKNMALIKNNVHPRSKEQSRFIVSVMTIVAFERTNKIKPTTKGT
ncbi:hypothetical protein ABVT39_014740 [Epinephelus coioides]